MNIKQWYLYLFTNKCPECGQEMLETGWNGRHKCYTKDCKMFNIKR